MEDNTAPPAQPAAQKAGRGGEAGTFLLYPNPNSGRFMVNLILPGNRPEEARIEVMNLVGQTVLTHITQVTGGYLNEFISLPDGMAAGTYFVRLIAGSYVYTGKVNVSRWR